MTSNNSFCVFRDERSVSSDSGRIGSKNLLVTLKKADVGNVLRTVETNEDSELTKKARKRRGNASGWFLQS